MTLNYAHRGACGVYPENTLLAFEKAIEMGCDGIETDVQMTADGVLVLIHDESLKRTTGVDALVKDYTFEKLRTLNAASFHAMKDSFLPVPSAEELIVLAKKNSIILNLEIKTGIVFYEGIEKKLIELIYKHRMEKSVIISSFNHYAIVECKKIAPEIKTAALYSYGIYHPESYCKALGADAIHPHFVAADKQMVEDAHREGLIVQPYTVNREEDMKRLIDIGIDGIITNYPDLLRDVLAKTK